MDREGAEEDQEDHSDTGKEGGRRREEEEVGGGVVGWWWLRSTVKRYRTVIMVRGAVCAALHDDSSARFKSFPTRGKCGARRADYRPLWPSQT